MGFDGKLLALDLATTFGWSCGFLHEIPHSGSEYCGNDDRDTGRLALTFGEYLQNIIKAELPQCIAFEAPLDPRHLNENTNLYTTTILYGMPFLAEAIATKYRIPIYKIEVQKIRKHFVPEMKIPRGLKADKRKREISKHVIEACRNLGWQPLDGDAADAMAVWSCARSYLDPKYAVATTPLFAESAA